MEWKSGMKVRCIESYLGFKKGGIFELTERYCFNNGWETNPTVAWYIRDDMKKHWEVVKMEFTKDDLKVGMLVIDRYGTGYIVMNSKKGLSIHDEQGGWMDVKGYRNNLTRYDENITSDFDIMKVYDIKKKQFGANLISTEDRELLWERKEEEIKEVTMEQLEKDYGCKVKIVKNK